MAARLARGTGMYIAMEVSRSRRRGGVDPKLILAIVLFVIAGGILWWFYGGKGAVAPDPGRTFTLICSKCKAESPVKAGEIKNVPRQGGYFQCPKCQAFSASFGEPGAQNQTFSAP